MAANDYFRGSLLETYHTPPRLHSPAVPTSKTPSATYQPYSATASSTPFESQSSLPSYESKGWPSEQDDPRLYPSRHGQPSPAQDQYEDNLIPMKPTSKISPSQDSLRTQDTAYSPSPDSQKGPSLVPHPTPMKKRDGFFTGRIPWVTFTVTLIQISVFIAEVIKSSIVTGSPIMIHPQFNPMIGPSTYILINMGARFVPCMRTTPGVQDSTIPINWPCPNTTTSDSSAASNHCDLSVLCGFSGVANAAFDANPNQWWRFVVPMFLHAGIIHIGFNMLLQLTMGREMELAIGSIRFGLVYFSSGIFGFVLGGNFAATAIASTGASGCLFGILALTLLDLVYCWNERRSPIRDLMWIMADVLISFVLGLLPGLDNFSHIGGFLMGLAAGICILHSPNVLRQRIGEMTTYTSMNSHKRRSRSKKAATRTAAPADVTAAAKDPIGFFKGRKSLWWAWWLMRAGALIGALVCFFVLLNNFYKYRDSCAWCKYLSCLPINNWCSIGNLQLTNTTTTNKRDLFSSTVRRDMSLPDVLNLWN